MASLLPTTHNRIKWLHQFHLHPPDRLIWWRLFWNALPTQAWLHLRGMNDTELCQWDCGKAKNTSHIAMECSNLKRIFHTHSVWSIAFPCFLDFFELTNVLDSTTSMKAVMAHIYCSVMYQNWKTRNAKKHGSSNGSPTNIAATTLKTLIKLHKYPVEHRYTNHPARLFNQCS